MGIYDVVIKLIGPINPVGESRNDDERFENLKNMTSLVDSLLMDIKRIAEKRDSQKYSVKRAGAFAHNFLAEISLEIPEEVKG